ncbi:MAG: VWA domain-containing protein [Pyrinomonadaceae bacterium]
MLRSHAFLIVGLLFCSSGIVFSQTPPKNEKEEIIRVDTELVDVPLSVTDRTGKPIKNLTRANFSVYENGKLQKVEEFSAIDAPFEVALLLDTSGSTRSDLDLIRRAAQEFISSLRPGDRVAITAFRSVVRGNRNISVPDTLTELTSDRSVLRNALERVGVGNGTPYYDSLAEIASRTFKLPPTEEFRGRRALVALTDGVDSTSVSSFPDAKNDLAAIGISAYFININTRDFFEDQLLGNCEVAMRFSQGQINRYFATFGKGSKVERPSNFCGLGEFEKLAISKVLYETAESEMSELAKISGGRVFPAADLSEARKAFKQVADEIGTRYSLGYYSTNETRDGKFRAIKVELKNAPTGSMVRAREGYTAPAN